jgi:Fusaric acid resistance protein family
LASLADGHALPTREQWASWMLDRVALSLYRQPRFEPRPQHEFADALEDLRLGVNMIETQSIAPGMSQSAQEALAEMFAGLAPHFRALAQGRVPPFNSDLLQKVDIAINEVAACTEATHACVAAVVGLRRTLYPNAAPYRPAQLAPASPEAAATVSVT